jgi:hypothetical protein
LRMIYTSPPDPLSAFERRSMTRRLMRKGGKRGGGKKNKELDERTK